MVPRKDEKGPSRSIKVKCTAVRHGPSYGASTQNLLRTQPSWAPPGSLQEEVQVSESQ